MTSPHRIRTLRFDVRTTRAESAFWVRQHVAGRARSAAFAQALETLFDDLVPPGVTCRIERLEVPVGILLEAEFDQEWVTCCLSSMETALRQAVRLANTGRDKTGEGPALNRAQTRTEAETTAEAFREFLATGNVPWWATVPDWAAWEQTILRVSRENPAGISSQLAFLLAQPDAARRLVWQFTPAFVWRLVGFLAGTTVPDQMQRREAGLRTAATRSGHASAAIRVAMETDRIAALQELAAQNWVANEAFFGRETPGTSAKETGANADPESLKPLFLSEQTQPAGIAADSTAAPAASSKTTAISQALEQTPRQVPERNQAVKSAEKRPAIFPEKGPWFIQNAGLVLLHPFLAPLLAGLELFENGAFRPETARHRAVHLLAHLVGQPPNSSEMELVLPKILTGLAPQTPIRRRVRLTKAEKSEARNLLLAVLGHWKALKNTTPEALQAEFLQREGRLDYRDAAWYLTVERRTADVLLNRLPWGISLVKLPWMPDFLHVAWA